jgi:hypothetical protein
MKSTKDIKQIIAIFFLAFFFFTSCEKNYDNVIDTSKSNYQVKSVFPKDSVIFNLSDSSVVVKIEFTQESRLNSVYAIIFDPSGKKYISNNLSLYDNGKSENGDSIAGDKIYANKILMKSKDPNGNYLIKYFVDDDISSNRFVAQTTFKYRNGEANLPPTISNALIDPDTLTVTTTTTIQTRINASDPNGLNDIKEVYFIVFRPDGSTNNVKTQLYDDGNISSNGDLVAGDGIFSRKIQVNETNTKGTYVFEFRAVDRGGLFSNVINYRVLIQ